MKPMLVGTVILRKVMSLQDLQREREEEGEGRIFFTTTGGATYIQKCIGETTKM
jgi:hypothetical protein